MIMWTFGEAAMAYDMPGLTKGVRALSFKRLERLILNLYGDDLRRAGPVGTGPADGPAERKKPKSGSGQKWARGRPPPHAVFINPQPYPRPQVGRGGPGGCRTPLFGLVAPSRTLVVGLGGNYWV